MEPSPSRAEAEAQRLTDALERLLGRAMGIKVPAVGRFRSLAPLPFASIGFAAYALLAGLILALPDDKSDPRFVSLLAWGLVYYTAVLFLCRAATLRALDTVRRDILPYATPAFIAAVADDLELRHSGLARRIVPWIATLLVALVASSVALNCELAPNCKTLKFEELILPKTERGPVRLLWSPIAFYLCFVAARGVLVGRFYESFALHLAKAQEKFYVLGAADTPLVKGVARLSQQMVGFWAMIFLAILSIMLLSLEPLRASGYGLQSSSPLLAFVVPTAGFASLGYGSLVYLRSESEIRRTLFRFATAQSEDLQRRCNARLDPLADRLPGEGGDLERLSCWNDRILAGARYGNWLVTALSVALPLVMPLIGLVGTLLGPGGGPG
jgi:hypothetical protein